MPTLRPKNFDSNLRTYSKRESNEPNGIQIDMKHDNYSTCNSISNNCFTKNNMSDDLRSEELPGITKYSPRISKYTNLDKSQISNLFLK